MWMYALQYEQSQCFSNLWKQGILQKVSNKMVMESFKCIVYTDSDV